MQYIKDSDSSGTPADLQSTVQSSDPATYPSDSAVCQSPPWLRSALATLLLTLIMVPGGYRALTHDSFGWESWWFARFLVPPLIIQNLAFCWLPLAKRYFSKGDCRDVPAFMIASATLLLQLVVSYALFDDYSRWHG